MFVQINFPASKGKEYHLGSTEGVVYNDFSYLEAYNYFGLSMTLFFLVSAVQHQLARSPDLK